MLAKFAMLFMVSNRTLGLSLRNSILLLLLLVLLRVLMIMPCLFTFHLVVGRFFFMLMDDDLSYIQSVKASLVSVLDKDLGPLVFFSY